jgi:hypothetical protein
MSPAIPRTTAEGLAIGGLIAWLLLLPADSCWAQSGGQTGPTSPAESSHKEGPASSSEAGQEKKAEKNAPALTRIRVSVTSSAGKPIENASVYVRFSETGGFFHHEKEQELDLKTNQDGSVKVPEIPQGKVLIQVVAKGWKTFGKWYEIHTDEQMIEIKLDPPPHWY